MQMYTQAEAMCTCAHDHIRRLSSCAAWSDQPKGCWVIMSHDYNPMNVKPAVRQGFAVGRSECIGLSGHVCQAVMQL